MLFEKFFSAISRLLPDDWFTGDLTALSKLDPSKIYVENVRAVLRVSTNAARMICESCVSQGVFERGIEARTSDDVVVATAKDEASLPRVVRVHVDDGDFTEVTSVPVEDLRKVTFYRLVENAGTRPHPSAT